MDIISFTEAATANTRISSVIADPDSTSGVLTVPKTIASGENITIPSGRVAVLPNVQIDGTLNVQGDVFIPSGATLSGVVEKVTSTDNAIVRFDGTTGKVQNSGVIIDDSGNVGIGVTPSVWHTSAKAIDLGGKSSFGFLSSSTDYTLIYHNSYVNQAGYDIYKQNGYASSLIQNDGKFTWRTAPSGTAGSAITWNTAMTLDSNGNLLVGVTSDTATPNNGVSIRNTVGTVGNIGIGHASGTATGNAYQIFAYAGTQIGSIYQSGTTAVVYATTSDYRLKENIRPADCKRFMDIKFVDYERIDGRHECGVIAHELQEIYPDLVTGEKDATEIRKIEISPAVEEVKDEDGNVIVEAVEAVYEEQEFPVYQQVNYMGLIARIGTVVQQQAKLIEAMRAEIDELKGIGGAK